MNNFIQRTYIDNKTNKSLSFNEIILNNNISVVLGEPSSGKTYQFKEYENNNKNNTLYIELRGLKNYEKRVNTNHTVFLIDSIDEALLNVDKTNLIENVIDFISYRNNNAKFVISCRYSEWKEYFEEKLKEIGNSLDDNLNVYTIQNLTIEHINKLLEERAIVKNEFWTFIKNNYLEQFLENIIVFLYLIDNFKELKNQNISYHKIYEKIIIKLILAKGKYRDEEDELENIKVKDRFSILSSLSLYMTLNSKLDILTNELDELSDNLYEVETTEITPKSSKLLLKNSLFEKKNNKIKFIHKSMQEFLSAYFIYDKKLDLNTIKSLFAHKYGFYEEFEELIIVLTGFENYMFDEFVEFDPFIFRRAIGLSEKHQELLLINIIKYLQDDYLKTKIKTRYLRNSSLNKIKLENIVDTLKSNIDIENITKQTYQYILGIFQYEYSQELEDFILSILNYHNDNIGYLLELVNSDEVKNINDTFGDEKYRKLLLKFILDNNLIDKNIDDVKSRIFNTLYQKIDFKELLPIFTSSNQHQAFMYYHSMVKRLTSNELVQIFNELLKSNNVKLNDDNLTIIFLNIFKNYADLYNQISLADIDEIIIKTNMQFSLTYSTDEIESYKDIKIENLLGDKEKVNVPKSILPCFNLICSFNLPTEKSIVKPKEKQLTLKEIENKIKYWIKNQELNFSDELYLAMRNIETIDLSNKDFLIEEFKLLYKREYLLLKLEIKTVILQIIALDKNSYDFFKIFWLEDIKNNYFYFRYMVQSNTNQAIDDFRKAILKDKASIDIFKDDEKLDVLETNPIDRNILKYILTSMGYIKINKRQYNFVANINDITDENLKFLIVNYYDSFNQYEVPQKGYRLDDYAVMNNVITTMFKKMEIDVKRTMLLDKFILSDNMYLKTISSKTLNAFYEYERKNRNIDNDEYKKILDDFKIEEERKNFDYEKLLDDLILIAEKELKESEAISQEDENTINDRFIKALEYRHYNVSGEARVNKKNERDIIIKDINQSEKSIIEAFKIKSIEKDYIKEHYNKVIGRYDPIGHPIGFLLIYTENKNFNSLWERYFKYLHTFSTFQDTNRTDKLNIKIGKSNDNSKIIYHVFINFYIEKKV